MWDSPSTLGYIFLVDSVGRGEIYIQFHFKICVIPYVNIWMEIEASPLRRYLLRTFLFAYLSRIKKSPGNLRCAGLNPSLGGRRRHSGNTCRRIVLLHTGITNIGGSRKRLYFQTFRHAKQFTDLPVIYPILKSNISYHIYEY